MDCRFAGAHVRGPDHDFRRYTADIDARAADFTSLEEGHRRTFFGSANGSGECLRAGADDGNLEARGGSAGTASLVPPTSSVP